MKFFAEKKGICAICGGRFVRVLLTITEPDRFERHAGISEEGYWRSWVECADCGAATDVYGPGTHTRLHKLATAYYAVDFKSSSLAEKYKKVMALPERKSDNAQRVLRIHAFMDDWLGRYFSNSRAALRVLDIGAGLGVFLARFLEKAAHSYKATAVESDPLACRHLRSLHRFRVVQETFPGKTPLGNFDLCTLNKVVEHVSRPVPFLQKIKRALSLEKGILYIELPDKLTINYRPPNDNILGALHHHLYDPRSITILLERAGFVPLQVMRFFEPSGKITSAAFATLPSVINALAKR